MGELDHLTYAAVITIERPDGSQAEFNITLTPPDVIEGADGEYRPLYQCTFEDLQHYADKIEKEMWAEEWGLNLMEMADSADTEVEMRIKLGQAKAPEKKTDFLRYGVLIPELEAEAEEVVEAEEAPETIEAKTPEQDEVESEAAEAQPEEEATPEEPKVAEKPPTPWTKATEEMREQEVRIMGLRRPPGHPTKSACDILINESAFRDAQRHSLTSLNREVAGMLIGPHPEQKEDGRWIVHVSDAIVAKHTEMRGASVTYTPESWRYIHDVLAEKYPNEEAVIVGWYHTHPGFGIFLSGMDLFIHQNFFVQPWHIALVLDPVAHTSGFFSWDKEQSGVRSYDFPWPDWAPNSW